MAAVKKYSGFILFMLCFVCFIGSLVWYANQPVSLVAEELTSAGDQETYPGTSLVLDFPTAKTISATVVNDSGRIFCMDDSPYIDVDILLDGSWYTVPRKSYAVAGASYTIKPGRTYTFQPTLEHHGKLPDGQYRMSFQVSAESGESDYDRTYYDTDYHVYARFDVVEGGYVPPEG